MGIRLRKRLGYGYATPKGSADEQAVPRIVNPESFLLNEDRLPFDNMQEAWEDFSSFADAWAKDQGDRVILLDPWFLRDRIKEGKRLPFVQEVVCKSDQEFDEKHDVIAVTPVGLLESWTRFDNMIDYVEEQNIARRTDLASEVHVLTNGIYPFSATYLRQDTMERLDNDIMYWIRGCNDDTGSYSQGGLDDLAQLAGFESHAQALELVIPKPPEDAVAIALWGKLFLNEADAYKMRPLYYKYWR